jgi:hypothetical protein
MVGMVGMRLSRSTEEELLASHLTGRYADFAHQSDWQGLNGEWLLQVLQCDLGR